MKFFKFVNFFRFLFLFLLLFISNLCLGGSIIPQPAFHHHHPGTNFARFAPGPIAVGPAAPPNHPHPYLPPPSFIYWPYPSPPVSPTNYYPAMAPHAAIPPPPPQQPQQQMVKNNQIFFDKYKDVIDFLVTARVRCTATNGSSYSDGRPTNGGH